jgi:hypothetical protein
MKLINDLFVGGVAMKIQGNLNKFVIMIIIAQFILISMAFGDDDTNVVQNSGFNTSPDEKIAPSATYTVIIQGKVISISPSRSFTIYIDEVLQGSGLDGLGGFKLLPGAVVYTTSVYSNYPSINVGDCVEVKGKWFTTDSPPIYLGDPGSYVNKITCSISWRPAGGCIKSDPFVIGDDSGNTHVLAVGCDDALWDYVIPLSGSGGNWYKLYGGLTSNLYASRRPIPGGDIHVFARGMNGGLWDCEFSNTISGPDEYWHNLGGVIISDSSAGADPNQPGRLSVAVKGSDNALWINDLDTNSIWGLSWLWKPLGGILYSNPRVIFDDQKRMHTFVRGGDGALWDNVGTWTGSGYNSKWYSLGGVITSDPKPLKKYDGSNLVYIYVRGSDGSLWENKLDTQTETGLWTSFGGYLSPTSTRPIYNMENPEPSLDAFGNTHVFVQGGDKALWDCVIVGFGGYQWICLGGIIESNPSAYGDIVAVRGQDGSLWIYGKF